MAPSPAGARLLGGRYRLHSLIATGGMGEVWRGTDELLDRPVAVKLLKPEYAEDPALRSRFRGEARLAAGLAHPGIAQVFDYGETPDASPTSFLVMELVAGEPLSHRLHREGALPVAVTLDLVAQVGAALEAAHRAGVVHRDIKPGNLLVCPDGTIKVTDFGIARAVGTTTLTEAGTVLGTASYLSPEQASGSRATPASDVYALGVVAYECLSGHRPFDGENPVAVALAHQRDAPPALPATIPAPVTALVLQCLAKVPAERPASAGALARTAAAVRAALYGEEATGTAPLPAAGPVPTRALPLVDAAGLAGAGLAGAARRRAGGRRGRLRVPLAGLALLALLLLVGLLRGHAPARVGVPRLAGLAPAAAQARLRAEHLRPVLRQVASTGYPSGQVAGTSPGAGTLVAQGSTVTVLVSTGAPTVTVDPTAYLGQPETQVAAALQQAGLQVATSGEPDATASPGTVIGVSPSGPVPIGGTVTLTVATSVQTAPGPPAPGGHDNGKGPGGHGGD